MKKLTQLSLPLGMMHFSKYLFAAIYLVISRSITPSQPSPYQGREPRLSSSPCQGGGWEGVNIAILYDGIFMSAVSLSIRFYLFPHH